jgi:hypothetical protein
LVILLIDPQSFAGIAIPTFRQHSQGTADAIRKPLQQNGLMHGAMLPRQQNDEGSAKAGPAIDASGSRRPFFSVHFTLAGQMPWGLCGC